MQSGWRGFGVSCRANHRLQIAAMLTSRAQFSELATKQDLKLSQAELIAEIRALGDRMVRFIVVTTGVQLTALAVAVAIILGTR